MDGFEMRSAVPVDAETVADYHHRCFLDSYSAELAEGTLRSPDIEGMREQLRGWFQPGSAFDTWVVIIGDAPIAHVTISGHQLVHLFVDPDHQGIGLGRRLLEAGETSIAANSHRELELHTRIDNTKAIDFYRAAGWVMTDRRIHTVEHGISYDEHVLIKRLQ